MAKKSITKIIKIWLVVMIIILQLFRSSQAEDWHFKYPPEIAWPPTYKVQPGSLVMPWRDKFSKLWKTIQNQIKEKQEKTPQYWLLRQGK